MILPSTATIIKENALYYFANDRGLHLVLDKELEVPNYLLNGQHCLELLQNVLEVKEVIS